ncbi:MAG: Clp protease N-terminal domain-containing protein [Oscillospiraceae bacterium]
MKKPAYSAALDRVLFRASRLARELGGAQTGTEHLLLALSQERISQTGRILMLSGSRGQAPALYAADAGRRRAGSDRPGLVRRSVAARSTAHGARPTRLGAALCQPEHLLLALTRDDGYAAARVLLTLGVDLQLRLFRNV